MDEPALVAEHRYRNSSGRDEAALALYLHRRPDHDWYEVRVTLHEDGRVLGVDFTRMVTSRDEARPVWREQARRLRELGYRQGRPSLRASMPSRRKPR